MEKSNQNQLSQFITVSYFALSLAMCTLCAEHSINPFAKLTENPVGASCYTITTDFFTDGNALYTHFIQ